MGAASTGLVGYAWANSKRVVTNDVAITIPDLPPGLDGLRILHVTDTHFPANGESLERFLATAKELNYDLVLATGDYAESADGWPVVVEAFRRLDADLGIFASLGGHERYAGVPSWHGDNGVRNLLDVGQLLRRRELISPEPLIDALEEIGVTVLQNDNLSLEIGGELVRIVGIDDAWMGLARLDHALPPADAVGFRLLLSHTPDGLLHARSGEVDLALCGHTHGGQIRFPLLGAPVRHARSVKRHAAAGLLRVSGVPTYVSRGFGTTLLPFRLGALPELSVLELRRGQST
jgi:predicted MPP superfamily phosphohydrolase